MSQGSDTSGHNRNSGSAGVHQCQCAGATSAFVRTIVLHEQALKSEVQV